MANDGTIWQAVRPPPGPTLTSTPRSLAKLLHDEPPLAKVTPYGKPRIWAKVSLLLSHAICLVKQLATSRRIQNKVELLEVLPQLSSALHGPLPGVYMDEATFEPPILYLDGGAWPTDSLTADGSAEVTMWVSYLMNFFAY